MHVNLKYLIAFIATLAFAVVTGVILIRAAVRSLTLPVCWRCGASHVRRSANSGLADLMVLFLFLVPYRCRACRNRYYGFRTQLYQHQPRA
jgi:hypothetical protein